MDVILHAIGTALPPHGVEQSVAAQLASARCLVEEGPARLLPALYRRSGVRFRSSVLLTDGRGDESSQSFFRPAVDAHDNGPATAARMERYAREAPPLAHAAAASAFERADLAPADIGHLVTVSCTGFAAPGIDIALIRSLNLPASVSRTHIGFMGCHGAFNGLRTASALVAQSNRPALLVAVELCSLHFAYTRDPQQIVANSLFADGAAAVLLAPADHASTWRLAAQGSQLMPDSLDAMTWTIGDHGFEMTLSPQVPSLITDHLRPWLDGWLAAHGLTAAEIRTWAVHPGGPRILDAVAGPLNLPPDALSDSHAVLSACGNMSSPTILFILDRLRSRNAPLPCIALGFGPGLCVEVMLIRQG